VVRGFLEFAREEYIPQIARSRVCDDQTAGSEVGIVGVAQVREQRFTFRVKETGAECCLDYFRGDVKRVVPEVEEHWWGVGICRSYPGWLGSFGDGGKEYW
jgi:hypothetical protein